MALCEPHVHAEADVVSDGCFIITCLITRTLLVKRNAAKRLAAQAIGEETERNLHAFEDLTDIQNPDLCTRTERITSGVMYVKRRCSAWSLITRGKRV